MRVFDMPTKKPTSERDIAKAAAYILQESFIKAARSGKLLYVEDDILWSKTPHGQPVFIKKLSGRNPTLSKEINNRRTFKIKKRNVCDS